MKIAIKNITALLENENGFYTENCDIYIDGDQIVSIGDQPTEFNADKTIDGTGKLAIPGFINAHTHAYMTVFRNIADDLSFQDWLMGNIMPMEDKLTSEDGYWGAMLGCLEMIKTGTTCFMDMHMFEEQGVRAAYETGMRAVITRGLSGGADDKAGAERRINEALREMDAASKLDHNGRITFKLGPHAIYTCDNGYLTEIVALAKEKNLGINVHLSESRFEVSSCYENHGCSPVELLCKLGIFDTSTVAAHCVHLSDDDIGILAAKGVSVATNPISNLKLGNGFAPITKLQQAGVNICLGTDGAASNNALNMFREMGVLTLIHKGYLEDARAVSAQDALKYATSNGAAALGINSGAIKVGKKADIAIIDLDVPQFYPRNNIVSGLCYSASGSEVEIVIIDGKVVMENRTMCTVDEERICYEVERIRNRLGK